jgi:hypothetical protein
MIFMHKNSFTYLGRGEDGKIWATGGYICRCWATKQSSFIIFVTETNNSSIICLNYFWIFFTICLFQLSQWSGRIRLAPSKTTAGHSSIVGMVAICRPLQSTTTLEIRLDGNMFMSRHNLDMKFIYCDQRYLMIVLKS